MRISSVAFCFATLLLATRTAGAGQSHYLVAKAFNNFTGGKSVMAPELTPTAEAMYQLGVGGVGPGFVSNHALVDSDKGFLLLTSSAGQEMGFTSVAPADWALAARLEEGATLGKPAPSLIRVTMLVEMSGQVGGRNNVHLIATLVVNTCALGVSRDISDTVSTDLVSGGGCALNGIQGRVEGSALIIELQNPKSGIAIEAQIDATISYAGPFIGQIETLQKATLKVETVGGSLIFKSPTFLTTGEGAGDGGTPPTNADAGGDDASSLDGGASDATGGASDAEGDATGATDAASPPGGGGGGCSVGAAGPQPAVPGWASLAVVLCASALGTRTRRRR